MEGPDNNSYRFVNHVDRRATIGPVGPIASTPGRSPTGGSQGQLNAIPVTVSVRCATIREPVDTS